MIPTEEQAKQEIEKLKELAPVIRQVDVFGTSNRAQIEAQIDVLENNLDDNEIRFRYGRAGIDEETLSAAFSAEQWLDGEYDADTLSEDWEVLRIERKEQ